MKETEKSVFEEHYRVVAVERNRLLVRGILSGEVLTIINPEPTLTKESLSARYTQLLLRMGRLDCSTSAGRRCGYGDAQRLEDLLSGVSPLLPESLESSG